ncbi:ROK family protein [Deltaproteobacteria bacterium TL4]
MNRIGIDLGGTKTEIILTGNDPLEEIARKRVPTQQAKGYEFIIHQIAGLVHDFQKLCETPAVVGLGIPGSIYPKTGLVRNSNTLCLIGKPLKQDLEKLLHSSISIENDANCFALSEALLGAGKGHPLVAGVILGTGLGGGLVYKQELWSGLQGIAAEWGHSSIDLKGPVCWCGQQGCLESYISGTGIMRHARSKGGVYGSVQELYRAYESNQDPLAQEIIQDIMVYFGRSIANLIVTFDPSIIVLGGGVSNLPVLYTEGVLQVTKCIFNQELETPIVQNQLGDSSGVYGAALIAGRD